MMTETAMLIFLCLTGAIILIIAFGYTFRTMWYRGKIRRYYASDLNETAWGLIANAYGGDWDTASPEWKQAAIRWRDQYHETLPSGSDEPEVPA